MHQNGFFEETEFVLDVGDQTIVLDNNTLDWYLSQFNHNRGDRFKRTRSFPAPPKDSSSELWDLLGIKKTSRSDITKSQGIIYLDLNNKVPKELVNSFDLVTDSGNNEHPFDVANAYRTMHKLVKPGGLMWIDQCVYGGNGLFNMDQSFFELMACANKYSIIYSAYSMKTKNGEQVHIPASEDILDVLHLEQQEYIGISYIFRKTSDDEFLDPYQSCPSGDARQLYSPSFIFPRSVPERVYIPQYIPSIKYHIKRIIALARQRLSSKYQ